MLLNSYMDQFCSWTHSTGDGNVIFFAISVSTPEAASQLIDVITNTVKGKQPSGLAHGLPVYAWRQQQNMMQVSLCAL